MSVYVIKVLPPPFIVIMYKFKLNASYLLRGDLYGEEKLDCVWEFSTLNLLTFYLLWQLRYVCMNENPDAGTRFRMCDYESHTLSKQSCIWQLKTAT